jgi:hypothetical protein
MDLLRVQDPNGRVLAMSADGVTFSTAEGTLFATRTDDVLRMADGSVGTLIGAVVFVQNDMGEQVRAYWLEPALDTSA